jgi:type 1 glutamine amidotransferase
MASETRALLFGEDEFDFHRFEEKWPIFESFFTDAGITVEGTTDLDRLADLGGHDLVIDYLTDTSGVEGAAREGLFSFVRDGGGYVGVHCASDVSTFVEETDEEYEDLVGGAFLGHPENAEFGVEIVDRDHEITAGIEDFSVYDEPYDLRVSDDNRVLARMNHPDLGDVPVAWTRSYGDGRVFYLSLGHTDEALEHPAVQELLVRGVRWATGD